MPFDLASHLGAMTRTVEDLERDGQPAKAVVASRLFDTDAADLWDAITSPAPDQALVLARQRRSQAGRSLPCREQRLGHHHRLRATKHIAGTWEFARRDRAGSRSTSSPKAPARGWSCATSRRSTSTGTISVRAPSASAGSSASWALRAISPSPRRTMSAPKVRAGRARAKTKALVSACQRRLGRCRHRRR